MDEVCTLVKGFPTFSTFVAFFFNRRFLTGAEFFSVNFLVCLKGGTLRDGFSTLIAFKHFFVCLRSLTSDG